MPTYSTSATLPVPRPQVFAWHQRRGALQRMLPPGAGIRILAQHGTIRTGDTVTLSLPMPMIGMRRRWRARHQDYVENEGFCDVQDSGPFTRWMHQHRFQDSAIPDGSVGCQISDHIDYQLPGGAMGALLRRSVEKRLERMFAFRQRRLHQDLIRHQRFLQRGGTLSTVLISGSSGLIGRALGDFLSSGGHRVRRLVRGQSSAEADDIAWNPVQGEIDPAAFVGCDAAVHLAGSSIAAGRWTTAERQRIRASRIEPTQRLCTALARLPVPPRVLVVASGIGFYGDRGDEVLDEHSMAGHGFLPEVCREWEEATQPARAAGIRVVNLRIGMVLAADGGALARMRPVFAAGLGGVLGTGRQWLSWIALDDLIGAIHHLIGPSQLHGPVNACTPRSLTNAEFTTQLAHMLSRPALLPVPRWAIGLLLGDMGRELLLASARVMPNALVGDGFEFSCDDLATALTHELPQ